MLVSQSGETMDTLETARYLASQGVPRLAIVNQAESTLARESELALLTRAGPEIGVASTKAWTTQLALLACLALQLGELSGFGGEEGRRARAAAAESLLELPSKMFDVLGLDSEINAIAAAVSEASHALYLGRGLLHAVALEGALKLKEITYIHAEGYAGGEMKHGPLALVDEAMPVVSLCPSGPLYGKMASNTEEVLARGGRVLLISDAKGLADFGGSPTWTLEMPPVRPLRCADPLRPARPAPRLPRRLPSRHRCGSTPQPRQVRHRGIRAEPRAERAHGDPCTGFYGGGK